MNLIKGEEGPIHEKEGDGWSHRSIELDDEGAPKDLKGLKQEKTEDVEQITATNSLLEDDNNDDDDGKIIEI